MKRRILFTLAALLIVASIILVVGIVMLYWQAEQQQENRFDSEVQRAGYVAVGEIDEVLNGTVFQIYEKDVDSMTASYPNRDIYFQKYVRQYLIDTVKHKCAGFVKGVIDFSSNKVLPLDTLFYDTVYHRNAEKLLARAWESDIDVVQYGEWNASTAAHTRTVSVEMDSATRQLLDRQFLYRTIKSALLAQGVDAPFEFAVYTSYSSSFVTKSRNAEEEQLLSSRYFFRLKSSEKFLAPYYLIIYFPLVRGYLLHRMIRIVGIIAIFLLIILMISAITLYALYRQKKIADMKNDFINNMTHELKTPISTISLSCEVLSNEEMLKNPETVPTYVRIIKTENDRLKNMVVSVLRAAQLRRGQIALDIQKVNVHEQITSIAESISLQVSSKQGRIDLALEAENHVIFADPEHIRNIVSNLVENAVKYSAEAPLISVSTRNDEKHIYLSVRDNGIGIAKKNLKHLFEDFYRVPSGNVHNVQGYGLGLSYVKKIVLLHGGSISVNSEPNKGTEFVICLPIKK